MKTKLFIGLAMAAMMGVSCSNDETVNDYSPDNAIQFGTYVGRNAISRATIINNGALAEKGFGVFAYYTDDEDFDEETSTPNFMYNQQVTGEGTTTGEEGSTATTYTWSYTPVKYWPNEADDKLTFFAYAPYADDNGLTLSALTATGSPTITYKMTVETDETTQEKTIAIPTGDDVDGMVDVLYLTNDREELTNLTKQDVEGTVHFTFGHALSRVAFAARVMIDEVNTEEDGSEEGEHDEAIALEEETTITINSVKLTGKFHTSGTMNLNDGEWSFTPETPTDEVSYVLSEENFTEDENVFNSDKIATDNLNNDESYIMLFPQELDEENTITITVDYTVETEDENLEGEKSVVNNVITSKAFSFEKGFEQGKAYKFVLHLGMTSVKLSAEVGEWDKENTIVVNVPLNIASEEAGE